MSNLVEIKNCFETSKNVDSDLTFFFGTFLWGRNKVEARLGHCLCQKKDKIKVKVET